MPFLGSIIRAVGLPACIVAALLVYYEGLPGASRIPFLARVPIIGDLTVGRVHSHAADEVRRATAALVNRAELAAVQAQLDRERALHRAAARAATEARNRAMAARSAYAKAKAVLDKRIENDTSPDGAIWTQGDMEWLGR
jgi:ABC-type transporter lipoprotein component MlaA